MNNEEKSIFNEEKDICQSCGFPLMDNETLESAKDSVMAVPLEAESDSLIVLPFGTEKDGSTSEDFCQYCYDKGNFTQGTQGMSMEDMINACAPTVAETYSVDVKEAKKQMEEFFPKLKRWKQ